MTCPNTIHLIAETDLPGVKRNRNILGRESRK